MSKWKSMSRREFLKTSGIAAAGATLAAAGTQSVFAAGQQEGTGGKAPAQRKTIEIVHWSPNSASDGEVEDRWIAMFNDAHKGKGIQIRKELVPYEQYRTKLLSAVATGNAPDMGFGLPAGKGAQFARDGVTIPLNDLAKQAGLDLSDFSGESLKHARYPNYGGDQIFSIPMDLMSLQPEINVDHVKEAGLDLSNLPQDNKTLLAWAKAMTKYDSGGKVIRSGIMQTASAVQPNVTWGIVSEQMGFRRASDDLKTACVNPKAGIRAMEWVLALFDEHKVSSREVTDRYKAFGNGQGSIFWTGPWTINGYLQQGLNFQSFLFPQIGEDNRHTYFEMGGIEMYTQKDKGRYEATMQAIKWLSDNSFMWTTEGRGVSPRNSIRNRPDYKTAGPPWEVRGAFVEGMANAAIGEIPIIKADDFTIYTGDNYMVKTLDPVWVGEKKPEQAMEELAERWQKDLDEG